MSPPGVVPATHTLDDRQIAAAALASLDRMYPETLRALWERWNDPKDLLAAVRSGRAALALASGRRDADALVRAWQTELDLAATTRTLEAHRTHLFVAGAADFPFETDLPRAPTVLFGEGERPDALTRPRVAVVGTRAATPHGLTDARELGGVLARAGVTVVSGLAIGIDGAAHEGALAESGLVVGVLGTGLDVVYPRRHGQLHQRVREHGMLISEYRYGTGPHPSRFPMRNRIIAALADVVVVVEATATGGARITAGDAIEYGRDLCAYPGSRRNPAARGSNELLRNAHVVVDPEDVVLLLGMTPGERRSPGDSSRSGRPTFSAATLDEHAVHQALGGEPATVDEITARTGLGPGPVAVAVAALVRSGNLRRSSGLLWPT